MAVTERIPVKEKIGYSLGDAASHIVFDSSVAILAYYYTDIYGLPPAVMGTMFLLVRLLDAITDPIMGAIADATSTRWGRFRPWLLAICIPFAVSCVLVYSIPDFTETGKIYYAVGAYIFMTLMYTAINIPYCSLGAALTSDPRENLSLQSCVLPSPPSVAHWALPAFCRWRIIFSRAIAPPVFRWRWAFLA